MASNIKYCLALVNAPKPVTIKQMRSFLRSFKQLSPTLPNYAVVIHKLDQLVGGKIAKGPVS